jgi:hypothetical protein
MEIDENEAGRRDISIASVGLFVSSPSAILAPLSRGC